MTTTQPAEPKLLPCPLCGAKSGYTLADGSTYRWWSVQCAECGQELSECRSNGSTRLDDLKPARRQQADEAWNEAGAHAESLRRRIAELEESIRQLHILYGATIKQLESRTEAVRPSLLPEPTYTHADVRRLLDGIEKDAKRYGLELVCTLGGMGLRAAPK